MDRPEKQVLHRDPGACGSDKIRLFYRVVEGILHDRMKTCHTHTVILRVCVQTVMPCRKETDDQTEVTEVFVVFFCLGKRGMRQKVHQQNWKIHIKGQIIQFCFIRDYFFFPCIIVIYDRIGFIPAYCIFFCPKTVVLKYE